MYDNERGWIQVGIFLYEGFRDFYTMNVEKQHKINTVMGGAVEQAQWLTYWAPSIAKWTDEWIGRHHLVGAEHPGVLAYDVWNPMGWMFAHLASTGKYPDGADYLRDEWVKGQLERMLFDFFGLDDAVQV